MSEYQYYEFAAIDRPLGRAEMAELCAVSSRAQISPSGFVNHYEWGDLKADLRPLYLGWLAGAGELPDDEAEPEVPAGLSALSPAQWALAEFLEVDPDRLAAAAAGSAPMPQTTEGDDGRLDAWLDTWPREAMLDVLKLLAQGRGQEAERQVRGRHAAWLKAQRPSAEPGARRRRVAELNELAESLALVRQEHEAQERAKEEAKRRREREEELRCLTAEVDQRWEAIDAQARHGLGLRVCGAGAHRSGGSLRADVHPEGIRARPAPLPDAPRQAGRPAAPFDGSGFVAGMTADGDDELARLRVERRCRGFPSPCVNATRGWCRVGGTRMLRGIACVMEPRRGCVAIGDHR